MKNNNRNSCLRAVVVSAALLFGVSNSAFAQVVFTDVSNAAGIDSDLYDAVSNHGGGLNWIDYDDDGLPDLFMINGFNLSAHLYRNNGDGTFTNEDALLPTLANVEMMGSVFGDYDNDGDSDIYIFTDTENGTGGIGGLSGPPNMLLKNFWVENGRRTVPGETLFQEVAAAAGVDDLLDVPDVDGPAYRSATGGWLDYDRDGFLDLYVCHWMRDNGGDPGNIDKLYRNNGDGTFEDVTVSAGINDGTDNTTFRPCLAFVAAHLDDDLWPDLWVGNVSGPDPAHQLDFIYKNMGDGTFQERSGDSPGVGDDDHAAMGITVGDIDLDGDWDTYISDLANDDDVGPNIGNPLYLGAGVGITFLDDTAAAAGVSSNNSWGVNFFDADQDGYEDLFVGICCGPHVTDPDEFYINDGDGTFTEIGASAGFSKLGNTRGSSVADFDQDGDLDLAVYTIEQSLMTLYRNDTAGGNWLQLDLVGVQSNRDAIGAVATITAGGQTYKRQVIAGSSGHGADGLTLHFGVGSAAIVDDVTIEWPSGIVQNWTNQPVNVIETIYENVTPGSSVCNDMSFTDVTLGVGISHKYNHPSTAGNPMTGGAVAEDFDGDGWVDLYAVQGAGGPNLLYMNDQAGGFIEEAAARGADLTLASVAASAADYDNDGDIDIAVSVAEDSSRILVNDGTGNFTSEILLPNPTQIAMSSSWGDVDNDGLLELAIGQWNTDQQSFWLYRNDGGGVLTEYEFRNVPGEDNFVFSPRFADFNGDRLQDLHVVADFFNSELYLNAGNGQFDNVTGTNGTGGGAGGENDMGHAIGDYDGDGDLDIFTSDIVAQGGNRLYNNNGSAVFTQVQDFAGVSDGEWGWAAAFGDLDNDGDMDLYHVNGWHAQTENINTPSRLFINHGDGTFTDVASCAGADDMRLGKGMLQFDYDNDGDLDIFIVNSQDMQVVGDDDPGTPVLLRNDTNNGNHWLQVTLDAQPPLHRNGIGSRVYARTGGSTMMRELHASTNFLAQDPGRIAHFGTGGATIVDEVIAEWVDGDATIIPDVAADQRISVPSNVGTVSSKSVALDESITADASAEPNPKEWEAEGVIYSDPATISFDTGGIKDVTLLVYDATGTTVVRKEVFRIDVAAAEITTPVPGSTLSGDTVTFSWADNGLTVTDWQLQVGTFVGDNSIYDSGLLASGTSSDTVSGLPTDGSTVHVRLSYTVNSIVNTVDYQYTTSNTAGTPQMVTPAPGSTFSGDTVTFDWTDNGAGVSNWRLVIGTSPQASDLYLSPVFDGAETATTVSGLPTDGSTIYVTLRWVVGVLGQDPAEAADYTYTASSTNAVPSMTSPVAGSTLSGDTETFVWSDNGAVVTDWQLQVGTTTGDNSLYDSGVLASTVLSDSVGGLPTDGSTIFVRLSYTIDSTTSSIDYTYTAANLNGIPELISPVPNTTLAGDTVTFTWSDNGAAVTDWLLQIGTFAGDNSTYDSGTLASTTLSDTVSGLPTDGSTVFVRLSYTLDGNFVSLDYQFTASNVAGVPELVSPIDGSILSGDTVTFDWTDNGAGVTNWRLVIGTSPQANDLYLSPVFDGSETTTTVSGLPTDGSTVYVTLRWVVGVLGQDPSGAADYTFTAVSTVGTPAMTSPVPGSSFTSDTVTFTWSENGAVVTDWQLQVGTSIGDNSLYDSGVLAAGTLTDTVSGLPTDGSTVNVRLLYTIDGVTESLDYTYTANNTAGVPELLTPIPGTTLSGDTVTFTWTDNGAGVSNWRLVIGSTQFGNDLYLSPVFDGSETTATVSGLPTDGSTVFVTLRWVVGVLGQDPSEFADYTFTASSP
jgi:hypothetical protein